MKEHGIDAFKYRKSTHLSGSDVVSIMELNNGKCILTIKDAYYTKGADVAGKKADGYFLDFVQDVKPAMLNSINRKRITGVCQIAKGLGLKEARNVANWVGLNIELIFDETVKFGSEVVGGFRVLAVNPTVQISDVNGLAILNASTNELELKANWSKLTKEEQSFPTIVALKDKLKVDYEKLQ